MTEIKWKQKTNVYFTCQSDKQKQHMKWWDKSKGQNKKLTVHISISTDQSFIFLLEILCQRYFKTPGLWRGWRWWTSFVLNRSESSNTYTIIRACPANFKQAVWQSCGVGALFWLLASRNTFPMKTWETFPSIASKRLSVHHVNRPEVPSRSSSQENVMLACDKMLGFQLAGFHLYNRLLTELYTCIPVMMRHVSLCVRTIVMVFT